MQRNLKYFKFLRVRDDSRLKRIKNIPDEEIIIFMSYISIFKYKDIKISLIANNIYFGIKNLYLMKSINLRPSINLIDMVYWEEIS